MVASAASCLLWLLGVVSGLAQPLDSAMGWEVLCECLHHHLQELRTQCKD